MFLVRELKAKKLSALAKITLHGGRLSEQLSLLVGSVGHLASVTVVGSLSLEGTVVEPLKDSERMLQRIPS